MKDLEFLWDDIKAAGVEATEAEKDMIAPLWEVLKTNRPFCNKCLDVQQGKRNALFTSTGEQAMQQSFVSYLRVSTRKQAASGLGLDAQRDAVATHLNSCEGELLREFQETESGKRADRPELGKALAFARRNGAILLVAKLDRLARNVAFLSALMESGVEFVACDNAHASRFTVHILAAVAEHERELISKRTKDALAEVKKRGKPLGSAKPGHWDGLEEKRLAGAKKGNQRSAQVRSEAAMVEYADLLPLIQELKDEGKSLRNIAETLNDQGERTRRGKPFTAVQVQRILNRRKST